MTEFEFVFIFYSLFLGFSLIEVLTGLGNAMERKFASDVSGNHFKIGWLTPLLAVFVVLDLLSFWMFAWVVREQIDVTSFTLLAIAIFASAYFLASRLVFPSNIADFANLDIHYFRVRRVVLGFLLALVFLQWSYLANLVGFSQLIDRPTPIILTLILIGLMSALILTKSARWSVALLCLLIARYVGLYLSY